MQSFTSGNPTKQILSFALPMLIGNVFQQFYSMADALIVGRYVSGDALAAVGTAMPIVQFMISVLIGLTTGASVVISQFFGAGDEKNLRRSVSTSIIFLFLLSVVTSVGGILLTPAILRLQKVPVELLDMSAAYLRILLAGMLFPIFFNMYTAYMRALGDSVSPLIALILATLLNVVLDIWFVGSLRWGVAGAAWATIIAQTASFAASFLLAAKRTPLLRVEKLVFDRTLFRPILRYSIPSAIQLSGTSLASLTIARLINGFGSTTIAGYAAALKLDQFALMPISNLSMATSTFVGQNMGAMREDRAKQGFRSSLAVCVLLGVFCSAAVLLLGKPLISLFIDPADAGFTEIVAVGARYFSIMGMFYLLHGIFFAFNGFFRGVGDAVIVMALTISSLTVRAIAAHIMVLQFGMGVEAVAWSIPIGWGLCSLFCVFYYKKRMWAGKVAIRGIVKEDGGSKQ